MFQRPISRRPIGAAALASAAIFAILYYPPYARRRKVKDHIFLTFDDGPDPEWTPAILDALSAARSRGTFFLIGEAALQYPEIVARIASEGHTIGVHGLHHDPVTLCRASSISRELAGAQKAIMAAAGCGARLYRPPYGLRGPGLRPALARAGMKMALWTLDSRDYLTHEPDSIRDRVDRLLQAGDIVLLHDAGATGCATAAALPKILDDLADRGWRSEALG